MVAPRNQQQTDTDTNNNNRIYGRNQILERMQELRNIIMLMETEEIDRRDSLLLSSYMDELVYLEGQVNLHTEPRSNGFPAHTVNARM